MRPEDNAQIQSKFKSVRRIFRVIELIREQGEGLTAKQIAQEVGVNLSSCYSIIKILIDEGYIEKIPHYGGYKLGPTIPLLHESYLKWSLDSRIEPVIDELAQRAKTHAYLGLLSEGSMKVAEVKSPPKSPPLKVAKGLQGATHALALGKALLAGTRAEGVRDYIADYGLEAFTPRTIIHPVTLEAHLSKVHTLGIATDLEEFAENLCCVAAPIKGKGGKVEGAIGLSTTTRRIRSEKQQLVEMIRWAAEEASTLVREDR